MPGKKGRQAQAETGAGGKHRLWARVHHTQTHTQAVWLSDWLPVWDTPRYLPLLVFSFSFCSLFASVHKQINLPSTCWRWARAGVEAFWVWWIGRGGRGDASEEQDGRFGGTSSSWGVIEQPCSLLVASGGNCCSGDKKEKEKEALSSLCNSSSTQLLSRTDEITVSPSNDEKPARLLCLPDSADT